MNCGERSWGKSIGLGILVRMSERPCSKVTCNREAVATLTYVYADSTAVLGPLSTLAEPHSYDLCRQHSKSLTAPEGWLTVKHATLLESNYEH